MAQRKTPKKKTAAKSPKAPKATGGSKMAKLEQRISALEKKLSGGPAQARPQAPQGARPQMAQGRPQMPQGGMPRPPMPRPQMPQGGMPRPPMPGMRG